MSDPAALDPVATRFADQTQRVQAQRLGVLLFLASEGLLFGGLFALYASYRAHYPEGFAAGVRENLRWDGTLNTIILLLGSAFAALAVARLHAGSTRIAPVLLRLTCLSGLAFLALKAYEYGVHLRSGVFIGGRGQFFATHAEPGLPQFFDLYWLMTGLHALHVIVGIGWVAVAAHLARAGRPAAHHVELAAMYWHFVDLIWVYLWPMFYLMGGGF
jgi:cytochrome c oxidase subunit 3